jgi:hypothetical protein
MQNYSFIKFQPLAATTCRIIWCKNNCRRCKILPSIRCIRQLAGSDATIADAKHFGDTRYFLKSSCSDAVVGGAKYFLKSSAIKSLQDLMQVTVCRCKMLWKCEILLEILCYNLQQDLIQQVENTTSKILP